MHTRWHMQHDNKAESTNMITLPPWLLGMSTGVIFDDNQMAVCSSDLQPRQTVSIRTDASVFSVGFKIAGNYVCIDIIRKVNDNSPKAMSVVFPEVRSQVKPPAVPIWPCNKKIVSSLIV